MQTMQQEIQKISTLTHLSALCACYWGPNSKIYKVAKTSVKGFLGKCLKLYKKGDTIEFSRTNHRWHYLYNINLHFLTVFHPKHPPPSFYYFIQWS